MECLRDTENQFATELQLLMTETTNDPSLLKTLVCIVRQQHNDMHDEHSLYEKKLSTRYGLVFYEYRIIVPTNLRKTVISHLHKGHPDTNKLSMAARQFSEAIPKSYRRNAEVVSLAKCPVRTSNLIYLVRKKSYHQ